MDNIKTNSNSVKFDNTFYDRDSRQLANAISTPNFEIVQAVDSHYFSNHTIGSHKQICDIELTAVLLENMVCATDERNFSLQKGDVHICFKNAMHTIEMNKACRFQTLAFNVKPTSAFFPILQHLEQNYRDNARIHKNMKLLELIGEALFEFYAYNQEISPLQLDSLLGQILICLHRAKDVPIRTPFSNDNLLLFALHYIDKEFKDMVSVLELCEHIDYSYNYFFDKFVAAFGVTPKKYLTFKKMEYAAKQLLSGMSLNGISEELGYSSPYNFSRAFKSFTGLSPSAYKINPTPIENPLVI